MKINTEFFEKDIVERYLFGECADFSYALAAMTGLPVFGIFKGKRSPMLVHAFCTVDKNTVIDVEGLHSMKDIFVLSRRRGPGDCRVATEEDLYVSPLDEDEWKNAYGIRVATKHIQGSGAFVKLLGRVAERAEIYKNEARERKSSKPKKEVRKSAR